MTTYAERWGKPRRRVGKGNPMREARRERAAERLAAHVYDPERCKPGCPKRLRPSTEGLSNEVSSPRSHPRRMGPSVDRREPVRSVAQG